MILHHHYLWPIGKGFGGDLFNIVLSYNGVVNRILTTTKVNDLILIMTMFVMSS